MSHFVYVPSAFCSGSFTSLSESFERASNSQEEPPNRSERNWQQRAKKFWA